MNSKYLIYFLISLLVLYVVLYQFYFIAGFNGTESIVSKSVLNLLVGCIVAVNVSFIGFSYRSINSNKGIWLFYMLITSGIGSIHYYFKHHRHAEKNT